ncbi:MAG TPA: hypothetical protein HPQ04_09805 [Rhodospirillaceae bacterium]|nr:hypothetical protein [Rhodospirillaceae bacterium]
MEPICRPSPASVPHLSPKEAASEWRVRMMGRKTPSRFLGQEEPRLGDIMDDPITRRLMASDGVGVEQLQQVISLMREKLLHV